jgi:hypothetical protein
MHILTGDDSFKHKYLRTIVEMQELLLEEYNVYTPRYLIAQAWERHSQMYAAGFLHFDSDDLYDHRSLLRELGLKNLSPDIEEA